MWNKFCLLNVLFDRESKVEWRRTARKNYRLSEVEMNDEKRNTVLETSGTRLHDNIEAVVRAAHAYRQSIGFPISNIQQTDEGVGRIELQGLTIRVIHWTSAAAGPK